MGKSTKISWATLGLEQGATANPIRAVNTETGDEGHFCIRANGRCRQCYSSWFNVKRFRGQIGTGLAFERPNLAKVEIVWKEKHASQVWGWTKPTGVFWADMTDLNGHWTPEWMRYTMFAYALLANQHRHAFLTKRPDKYLSDFNSDYNASLIAMLFNIMDGVKLRSKKHDQILGLINAIQDGLDLFQQDNILWGVTIGHQEDMDKFAPIMQELKRLKPDMRLWVSYEPAHGPVNWEPLRGVISWLVGGGESEQEPGKPVVEADPFWFFEAISWCNKANVPYYHKQMGTIWARKNASQSRKGDIIDEWLPGLRIQHFPEFKA